MENMLLWGIFLLYISLSFNYSYCLSGANRAFLGLYKGIPESAVVAYGEEGEDLAMPYFSKNLLEGACASYFQQALRGYVQSYELAYRYECVSAEAKRSTLPDYAAIRLSFHLSPFGDFQKSCHFQIQESPYES